jgi:hypothetical protein
MVIAYVDARVVMDRLDEVLGVDGWQDDYHVLDDGACVCTLRVRIGGEWLTKTDVGAESEQPDKQDRRKASFSDALKRAAVKIGVGRYLYRLPQQWVDYDPQKKRPARTPSLPEWAMPYPKEAAPPPEPAPAPQPELPIGVRTKNKLEAKDAALAKEGLSEPGELIESIRGSVAEAKLPAEPHAWTEAHVKVIAGWVKDFEEGARKVKDARATAVSDLNQEEMEALAELLARKGCRLRDVAKHAGVKATAPIEEVSREQAKTLILVLGKMPDAKARAG